MARRCVLQSFEIRLVILLEKGKLGGKQEGFMRSAFHIDTERYSGSSLEYQVVYARLDK